MPRLPLPGADEDSWGALLNDFLQVSHHGDGRLRNVMQVLNVKDYGALGNGQHDDTAAIQTALKNASAQGGTVYFPHGLYRTTTSLYVTGAANLLGEAGATLILAGAPESHEPPGCWLWINLGIRYYGDSEFASRWSGRISGLRFCVENGAVNGEGTLGVLAVHNCERYLIDNNFFDFVANGTALPAPLAIWSGNTKWAPAPCRKYGIIRGNRVVAAQDERGTEGIDQSHGASHIIIEDNFISGVGDDLIGLHGVDHVVVRNNFCSGVDGSILLSNCSDFLVDGNHIERAPAPNGSWHSGVLLNCLNELGGTCPPCSGGRIVNNELVYPAGLNSAIGMSYMMRLRGVRRTIVANNLLRCDSTNVVGFGISVEMADDIPGWVDAEGIEKQGEPAKPRWLSIHGNRSVGTVPVGMGEMVSHGDHVPGPISWRDNDGARFAAVGAASTFSVSNRVIDGSPDGLKNVIGARVPDALRLWSGAVAVTNAETAAANGGVARFCPGQRGIVFSVKITFAAPLTAGTVTVHLRKNGSFDSVDDLAVSPDTPNSKRRSYYTEAVNNRFSSADMLEVSVVGVNPLPTPLQAVVELFGMYTAND